MKFFRNPILSPTRARVLSFLLSRAFRWRYATLVLAGAIGLLLFQGAIAFGGWRLVKDFPSVLVLCGHTLVVANVTAALIGSTLCWLYRERGERVPVALLSLVLIAWGCVAVVMLSPALMAA